MDEIQKELLEKLKCPCDTVVKQGERTRDLELTMAKIEQQLNALCEGMAEMKSDIKEIKENSPSNERFEKLEKRVDDLEKKPALRWNGLVDKAIGALIGGLIGYFLFKIGLGA